MSPWAKKYDDDLPDVVEDADVRHALRNDAIGPRPDAAAAASGAIKGVWLR